MSLNVAFFKGQGGVMGYSIPVYRQTDSLLFYPMSVLAMNDSLVKIFILLIKENTEIVKRQTSL